MKPSLSKKEETTLYWIGVSILGCLLFLALFLQVTHIQILQVIPECLLLRVAHVYCPGCGGSRGAVALFHGHVLQSFLYHPIVLYIAVTGGWYLISHTVEMISRGKCAIAMRFRDIYLYIGMAIIALNWIVRNVLLLFYQIYIPT